MAYNPGISYRGDQAIREGLLSAGDTLSRGIQQWTANKQESQFYDQEAQAIARLLAPRAAAGDIDPKLVDDLANFPSLSLGQKRGKLSGLKYAVDQLLAQGREQAAERRHRESLGLQERRVKAEEDRLTRDAMRNRDTLGMLLGFQQDVPVPIDPTQKEAYLRDQFPNADAEVIQRLLAAGQTREARLPELVNLGGRDVIANRFTGAFQVLHPVSSAEIEAQPVVDAHGKIIGYGIPTGRGSITFRRADPDVPPDGTPVPGLEDTHVFVGGRAVKKDARLEMVNRVLGNQKPGEPKAPPAPKVLKYNPRTGTAE